MSLSGPIQIALIAGFAILCLRLGNVPSAAGAFVRFWREAPARRPLRGCILVFLAIFAIDAVQTSNDDALTQRLGVDYSAAIHALEGDVAARVQGALAHPWITAPLAFCYVIGFIGLLIGLACVYDRRGDARKLVAVVFAYAANYLLVLPFYLVFPVREPWSCDGSGVVALTDQHLGPWVMALIRPMSGIDNCFPSYHVSLTFSLMLIARSGERGPLATFTWICGSLVIVSTVVLGFHWVIDIAAGLAAGALVHVLGRRFAARFAAAGEPLSQPCTSAAPLPSVEP